jgi:hypothetical protein
MKKKTVIASEPESVSAEQKTAETLSPNPAWLSAMRIGVEFIGRR